MRSTPRLCLVALAFLWQTIPGLLTAQCVPTYTLVGGNSEKSAVACAGDVDHDGIADWVVGSHGGYAALYSGADASPIYTYSDQGQFFGVAVSGGGDFNNDGFMDFAIGECNRTVGSASGRVYVYSGATGDTIRSHHAPIGSYNFGCALAVVGDWNGDNCADLAVGAPNDGSAGDQAGRVFIFSGLDGSTIYDITGEDPGDQFGYSLSAGGDINADGWPDLVVGAAMEGSGQTLVYSGRTGTAIYRKPYWEGHFGFAVAGVGDINADGYDDFAAGAFLLMNRVEVFSGLNGSTLHLFVGEESNDFFGVSVAGAGDLDQDGFDDILVGAPYNSMDGLFTGRVYAFSGRTGMQMFVQHGLSQQTHLGWSVCPAGDSNEDGTIDLLVSSGYSSELGQTFVYLLNAGECQLQGCCQGMVGDVNGVGGDDPTIGDVSVLIDHLFIGQQPLLCYEEGDINQSGGDSPTRQDITIGDLSELIDHLFISQQPLPACL